MSAPTLAPRMSRFKPSPSQIATARARDLRAEGRTIVSLTAGEPDFPTPRHVKQAVLDAMEMNNTKYTPINGTIPMRQAVSAKFKRENNLDYGLDQITVGAGTKQILFNCLMASVSSGDEVIVPAPYWTSYPDIVKMAGGTPVCRHCGPESGVQNAPEQLEEAINAGNKMADPVVSQQPQRRYVYRGRVAGLCRRAGQASARLGADRRYL